MIALLGCLVASVGCLICSVDFLFKRDYSECACFLFFGIGYVMLGIALRSG